jgi:hypothetical protein
MISFVRAERVVAFDQIVRADCVVMQHTHSDPTPRALGVPPSPRFRFSILFLFLRGVLKKLNGRKTVLGRASSKRKKQSE